MIKKIKKMRLTKIKIHTIMYLNFSFSDYNEMQ